MAAADIMSALRAGGPLHGALWRPGAWGHELISHSLHVVDHQHGDWASSRFQLQTKLIL